MSQTVEEPLALNTSAPSVLLFACIAAAAAGMECIAAFLLVKGIITAAIFLHVMVLLALGAWLHDMAEDKDRRLPTLLAMLTAVTGPFGAGICAIAALGYAHQKDSASSPSEWIEEFFNYHQPTKSERLLERLDAGLDTPSQARGVEPFQDVLRDDAPVRQKQLVITKIMRYFRPQFATLLKQATQDANAAVRVQAATALTKLEHDFMARYMQMEKSLRRDPRNREIRLRFAELCDAYAYAGITDAQHAHALRAKAIGIYEAALAENNDPSLRLWLARLHVRQNEPQKTCELLADAVASGDVSINAVLWHMEALFRLHKLEQLRHVATHYAQELKKFSGNKSEDGMAVWDMSFQASGLTRENAHAA